MAIAADGVCMEGQPAVIRSSAVPSVGSPARFIRSSALPSVGSPACRHPQFGRAIRGKASLLSSAVRLCHPWVVGHPFQ